jgi:GT2 family glycosyltransferase
LCIADDASSNKEVRSVISDFAKDDKRIKYVFRKTNGHICQASNSALDLASGKYIALLDHDDTIWPSALYKVVELINQHPDAKFIYSDEDKIEEQGRKHLDPFFKPDWSFEFLRSINYITHFSVLDRQLVEKVGRFRSGYEGAQDWDLFLRVSREVDNVYHIPMVLYSWRKSETSTAHDPSTKDYAYVNQKKALMDDIHTRGFKAKLSWQIPFSMWRVDYKLKQESLVSIVIPTKNQYDFIKRCLDSIRDKTTYKNTEVVIVDTGSDDDQVWQLYDEYQSLWSNMKVVKWTKPFNFSAACNFGADNSNGDYLLFLNNDTEVISPDWIEDMLGYAQQDNVGAVGCKLYYPNDKIQHAGIILGVGGQHGTPGIAGHFFPAFMNNPPQDPAQLLYIGGTRNFTAVTAACVMVAKDKFDKVKGFDPDFRIAFNDVDFCLKLYDKGWRNIYLPQVELYHYESVSIGKPGSKQRDLGEFAKEINMMLDKWRPLIENDPFYHPEFRRDLASARLKV